MSYPGTSSPANRFPKNSAGGTKRSLSANGKEIKEQRLDAVRGQPADLGTAPSSRVYTRDYSKVGREESDTDLITGALGPNPFRL